MTEDLDERRLVERIIVGQPDDSDGPDGDDPFSVFVRRYEPVVVRVLRRFRISQEDRDDCWQDVFLKFFANDCALLKSWHAARRGGSLKGYVAVTARRIAIDLLRSRTFVKDGRTSKREVPLETEFDRAGESESGDDSMDLRPEAIHEVARKCLASRHFELYGRYCRGENPKEIGRALNMTPDYVYVERHRMIRALRECLKQRGLWPS